ncbi:MAG: 50S ribosomal protein L25 [Saprospiraceae bacterium]|jgi:large subunit ribosomal protein L25|nr:50S ribosomal protein L25 [Candidatus Vicinibacter proximus]MBL7823445.1 50S ribosomal protein L25 [Saprospiraceae bacterium]MCC6842476.1 50S ribosomal protein L25 [Saprospiraceae bacterium]HRG32212.1 50S ribosomal protein L25 [Saprospiraceae bacterium]
MKSVVINGQERSKIGKEAAKSYRKEGLVPCVLYSKDENIQFNATNGDLKSLIYNPDFKYADIVLGGTTHRCILKEIQWHPVTDAVVHIDFLKLVPGTSIKVELPLRLKGAAVGVKSGGKMVQRMRMIKIKTVPEHLVSELFVDITTLDLGQTMRIRDITPENGIEIVTPAATPIVSIEIPRALKTAETATPAKK